MGIREYAEMTGTRVFGEMGHDVVACMAAWGAVVLEILKDIPLDEAKRDMALEIVEVWGLTIPIRLTFNGDTLVLNREMSRDVRVLFEKTLRVAEKIIDVGAACEVAEFCRAELADINHFSSIGDITCERWVLDGLVNHHRRLLGAVLGANGTKEFASAFNDAMDVLREAFGMASASPS